MTFGSAVMILNAAVTFSLRRAAADIEKIGRLGAIELDDVHRRHGKPGAIDHAADRAVERDIIEIVLRRFDLLRVFLAHVAQGGDIGMTEERVVVEADLGVEALQGAALSRISGLISSSAMSLATKAV